MKDWKTITLGYTFPTKIMDELQVQKSLEHDDVEKKKFQSRTNPLVKQEN